MAMVAAADDALAERVRARHQQILRLAAHYGAHNLRIFGSVARGEAGPDSDLDLLVDLAPDRTLLDLGGLQMDLQALLGCTVDVFTADLLRPRVRERALREAVPL
jgi:predicted nucleotidyltransferase